MEGVPMSARIDTYEADTRARYQNEDIAAGYHQAYTSFPRPSMVPARIIASRERRAIRSALGKCDPFPETVLDIPCGTGKLAPVLEGMGIRTIVGADISMEMMA